MIPIKLSETIQNILKIHVAFNNNLYKNWVYARVWLKVTFDKCKFLIIEVWNVNAAFFSIISIPQYIIIIKLHVNDLEAKHRYIRSVTSGQARIKDLSSAQFVNKK